MVGESVVVVRTPYRREGRERGTTRRETRPFIIRQVVAEELTLEVYKLKSWVLG